MLSGIPNKESESVISLHPYKNMSEQDPAEKRGTGRFGVKPQVSETRINPLNECLSRRSHLDRSMGESEIQFRVEEPEFKDQDSISSFSVVTSMKP